MEQLYKQGDVLQKKGEDDFHVEGMVGDIVIGYFISDVTGYKLSETYHIDELKDWKKKGKRWKPEYGDFYYCVTLGLTLAGEVRSWEEDEADIEQYENGNCFKTPQEQQAAAEKVKELLLSLHE